MRRDVHFAMVMLILGLLLIWGAVSFAHAQEPGQCKPLGDAKTLAAGKGAIWIELTSDQWRFLEGVFVLNPLMPAGLPYGDRAALAKDGEGKNGVVFFIDGDLACQPMAVPDVLIDMVMAVGKGEISHEGQSQ